MIKKKITEEATMAVMETTTIAAPVATKGYNELFRKIEALNGKERERFAKTLTLEEKKSYVKFCQERDSEMVTGVFHSFEPVGGSLKMSARAFDDSTVTYDFNDGNTYTIPKYVAKRLQNEYQGCGTWYPTHSHVMDENGHPTVNTGKKNRRFGFSSLDFQ